MKKSGFIMTALAVSMAGVLGLSACGGGNYSETFDGELSKQTYESTETAAKAFLGNEIDGGSTDASFVSYESKRKIAAEEYAEMNLGDYTAEDVKSAELGEITYTTGASTLAASDAEGENYKHVVVGVFELEDGFRYYIPCPSNGEMISQTYYESVLDPAKYTNCTTHFKETIHASAKIAMITLPLIQYNLEYEIKVTENAVEIVITTSGTADEYNLPVLNGTVYAIQAGTGIAVAENMNGEWEMNYGFTNIKTLSDFSKMNLSEFLDFSYFEKTKKGFKLTEEKCKLFIDEYLDDIGFDDTGTKWSGEATYFVTEGRLSEASMKINVDLNIAEGGSIAKGKITASGVNKFSDFGTTVVTIPAGVQAFLDAHIS